MVTVPIDIRVVSNWLNENIFVTVIDSDLALHCYDSGFCLPYTSKGGSRRNHC